MVDRYTFPAIFEVNEYGVAVEFPDLPGCLTCADTLEEALRNAKEAMELHLYSMEQDSELIPEPSNLFELKTKSHERAVPIEAWMPLVRLEQQDKAVKKTLTIPAWLEAMANEKHVNFSHVLQQALTEVLGIDGDRSKLNANMQKKKNSEHHPLV